MIIEYIILKLLTTDFEHHTPRPDALLRKELFDDQRRDSAQVERTREPIKMVQADHMIRVAVGQEENARLTIWAVEAISRNARKTREAAVEGAHIGLKKKRLRLVCYCFHF